MPTGSHTRPEQIVDRNGKATTVHKGRAVTPPDTSARVSKVVATKKPELVNGMEFTYIDELDGATKYVITNVNGRTVDAESQDEYKDIHRFSKKDVYEGLDWDADTKNYEVSLDQFWDAHPEGEILHYDNGFGEFVRGEVVTGADGHKSFKPVGLVGNWRNISGRGSDGEPYYTYHAARIMNLSDGSNFRPSNSTIWEYMSDELKKDSKYDFIHAAGGDISNIPNIDFTVPEIGADEAYRIKYDMAEMEISFAAVNYELSVEDRIAAIRKAVDEFEAIVKARG